MKKIVALFGSPRHGSNSTLIAQRIMDTAGALGARTQAFRLYDLKYSGCIACMGCKKTAEECVLRDDLTDVLRAVREADVLLLSSPIYFGQITGPLKSAIDRMYSFVPPTYTSGGPRTRLAPGKHCVFVITQGAPEEAAFAEAVKPYEMFFGPDWFGYTTHVLRGLGLGKPGEAAERPELMAQAEALAKEIMAALTRQS